MRSHDSRFNGVGFNLSFKVDHYLKIIIIISLISLNLTIIHATDPRPEIKLDKKSLKTRALTGDLYAQDALGSLYKTMDKADKAIHWFRQAAMSGNASAQNHLGLMLLQSNQDQQALHWFNKSSAQGNLAAEVNIGIYYYDIGQYQTAFKIFQSSALKGYSVGQYHLAQLYDVGPGQDQGIKKSPQLAVKWYTKAAKAGDAGAQYQLGSCYLVGHGIPQSFTHALKWSTRAAEQNFKSAQYAVSLMHAQGIGTSQSYEDGLKWCQRAAQLGHRAAQEKLGWINGIPIPNQSDQSMLTTFSIAIAQMRVEGQQNFDSLYRFSQGIYGYAAHDKIMHNLNSFPGTTTYTYCDRSAQDEFNRLTRQSDSLINQLWHRCAIL